MAMNYIHTRWLSHQLRSHMTRLRASNDQSLLTWRRGVSAGPHQLSHRGVMASAKSIQWIDQKDKNNINLFNQVPVRNLYYTHLDATDEIESQDTEICHDQYLLPNTGHRIFILQPKVKSVEKSRQTTAELQLEEACGLVESLPKWSIQDKAIFITKTMDKLHLFGKEGVREIVHRVKQTENVTAIFINTDMLSAVQLELLQEQFSLPVYDRFTMVLQIFKIRARSKEAKLQVALAEIPYLRSRLKGMHRGTLDQQAGGLASIGGSGETFLEVRQRLLKEKEQKIQAELVKVRSKRQLLRQERKKRELPVVSIVGYTNAGKTSLIRALTGEDAITPRNQLFSTLDVTAHAAVLPNKMKVILMDTVGFISDLPTSLVESFNATLEDAINADVLVHVCDVSHPDFVAQRAAVTHTLENLNLTEDLRKNIIQVACKTDLVKQLPELPGMLPVSTVTGEGLRDLKHKIQQLALDTSGCLTKVFKVPMKGTILSWLHKEATVSKTETVQGDTEHLLVEVVMTQRVYAKFCGIYKKKKT